MQRYSNVKITLTKYRESMMDGGPMVYFTTVLLNDNIALLMPKA